MNATKNQHCECDSPIDAGYRRSGFIVCARCGGTVGSGPLRKQENEMTEEQAQSVFEKLEGQRAIDSKGFPENMVPDGCVGVPGAVVCTGEYEGDGYFSCEVQGWGGVSVRRHWKEIRLPNGVDAATMAAACGD